MNNRTLGNRRRTRTLSSLYGTLLSAPAADFRWISFYGENSDSSHMELTRLLFAIMKVFTMKTGK